MNSTLYIILEVSILVASVLSLYSKLIQDKFLPYWQSTFIVSVIFMLYSLAHNLWTLLGINILSAVVCGYHAWKDHKYTRQIQDSTCINNKVNFHLDRSIRALNSAKMTDREYSVYLSKLIFSIGHSISKDIKSPNIEELEYRYNINPTIGDALMLQGLVMSNWSDSIGKANYDKDTKVQGI